MTRPEPELLYLVPGTAPGADERRRRDRVADERVPASVTVEWVGKGPAGIEAAVEAAWSVPSLLAAADERADAFDAVVVGCFDDTGLRELRELLPIPVVGPAEATVHTALQVADRFAWLTPLDRTAPMSRARAADIGAGDALTGVYPLGLTIEELGAEGALAAAMRETGERAVEAGAEALVPGCMSLAFAGEHAAVADALPVPLLDPLGLALEQAATWARLGVRGSPRTYPPADRDRLSGLLD